MSIFDKLKNDAISAVGKAAQSLGSQRETFTFRALPESLAEMQALPEAALDTPFQTAALSLCALCAYAADRQIGTEMLNWLRGPRPLSGHEISFLNDRFRDKKNLRPLLLLQGGHARQRLHAHAALYRDFLYRPLFRPERGVQEALCGQRRCRQCPGDRSA